MTVNLNRYTCYGAIEVVAIIIIIIIIINWDFKGTPLFSVDYRISETIHDSPRSRGSARPKTASSLILRGHV